MTCSELVLSILIGLFTTVVGILSALFIERQRRPWLSIDTGECGYPEKVEESKSYYHGPPCTWLHVRIKNPRTPWWIACVYDREPAAGCRAWITFYCGDDSLWKWLSKPLGWRALAPFHRWNNSSLKRVFEYDMDARWSDTAPPEIPKQYKEGEDRILPKGLQETFDIQPGEESTARLDIVWRARDDDDCYGWNDHNYLYDDEGDDKKQYRNPKSKLPRGRYIAKVRVITGGREFPDLCIVCNDDDYESFRLCSIKDERKKKEFKKALLRYDNKRKEEEPRKVLSTCF